MSKIQDLIDDLFFVAAEYIRVNNATVTEPIRDSLMTPDGFNQLRKLIIELPNPERVNHLIFISEATRKLSTQFQAKNWDKVSSYTQKILNGLTALHQGNTVEVEMIKDNKLTKTTLTSLQWNITRLNNRLSNLVAERIINKHRLKDIEEIIQAEKDKQLALESLQLLKSSLDAMTQEREQLAKNLEKANAKQQLATQALKSGTRANLQQAHELDNQTQQNLATIQFLEAQLKKAETDASTAEQSNQKLKSELSEKNNALSESGRKMQNALSAAEDQQRNTQKQLNDLQEKTTKELSETFAETQGLRRENTALKKLNKDLVEKLQSYSELFQLLIQSQQPLRIADNKNKIQEDHANIVTKLENILKNTQFPQLFLSKNTLKLKQQINEQLKMLFKFLDDTGSKEMLKETYFFSRATSKSETINITLIDYFLVFFAEHNNQQIPSWIDPELATKFAEYNKNGYQATAYASQLRLVNRIGILPTHSSTSTNGSTSSVEATSGNPGPSCPSN